MAGYSKYIRQVEAFLSDAGFVYEHTNSKGNDFWVHPSGETVKVPSRLNETAVKHLIHNTQKKIGSATLKDAAKRDPSQVKERQRVDRERAAAEAERARVELDRLIAVREQQAGGLSQKAFAALVREIESAEREFNRWRRLMEELPSPLNNTARHRA